LNGSSLTTVEIVVAPKGLESITHKVFAINNSNGSTVSRLEYNPTSGIATCTLVTPVLGFTTAPFSVDEEVYIEGLQKFEDTGTGFNSSDNGFNFFKISSVQNTNPATISFDLSPFTSNAKNI